MKARVKNTRGFTLIELLVVISIMAILAAIAIPTLIRAGAFQKEYIEQSGRTLYNMLKAAEFYASTYNVETCLAYAVEEQQDSRDPGVLPDVVVARSIGVFRRPTKEEFALWKVWYPSGDPNEVLAQEEKDDGVARVYVPVGAAALTTLSEGACILGAWDASVDPPEFLPFWGDPSAPSEEYPAEGLSYVRIRNEDGLVVAPHVVFPDSPEALCWPAHVFSPAGYVVSNTPYEQLLVRVGATPESNLDDRFIDPEVTPLEPIEPLKVQISKSSARIKIVE